MLTPPQQSVDRLPPTDEPVSPGVRWTLWLTIAAVAGISLAQILSAQVHYTPDRWPDRRPPDLPFFSANDRSRWCTVWSLAERGTFQIDEIIQHNGWDTIDKVRVDGHFYSTKPALLPVLVAGLYWTGKQTMGWDLLARPQHPVRNLLLLINWLPWLTALGLLGSLAMRYARTDAARITVILTAGLGTLLTPFLVTFNNHSVAAVSLVYALSAVIPLLLKEEHSRWRYASAGFWTAFAICNELPAAILGLVLFFWLLRRSVPRTLFAFVPAALVPLSLFFITTYASTGSWLPFYTKFGGEAYRYLHEGVPSYWMEPSGLDRSTESPWVYLFHCTLGHHGILALTPVFLLTLGSWFRPAWLSRSRLGPISRLTIGLTVWVLAFYLLQTQSYNYGGNTAGLRWAFWLIPFWLLGLIPAVDALQSNTGFRCVTGFLLGVSAFSAALPADNPWQKPWLQVLFERWGWVQYNTPVAGLPGPQQSWLGRVPIISEGQPSQWVEFAGLGPNGQSTRIRLEALPRIQPPRKEPSSRPSPANPDQMGPDMIEIPIRIEIRELSPGGLAREEMQGMLRSPGSGDPAEARWQWTPALDSPTPNQVVGPQKPAPVANGATSRVWMRSQLDSFLRGVPYLKAQYRPGGVRYLKTPYRPHEAFRAWLMSAHVEQFIPEPDRSEMAAQRFSYRRDVWLSDAVPFGVLQLDDTLRDPTDNTILSRQRWTMINCSGVIEPAK